MNTSQPLLSLGIPTFNSAKHIERLLQSIQAQTYTHLEVIILDNDSQDDTVERIQPFLADPRFRLVRSSRDMGAYYSLKRLVMEAAGQLFAWVASDFFLQPDYALKQVEILVKKPDISMVYTGVLLRYEDALIERIDKFSLMQESPAERAVSLVENLEIGSVCYGVVRTSLYRELLLCPPTGFVPVWTTSRLFAFGDLQLMMFVCLQTKVFQVHEILVDRDRTDDRRRYADDLARRERYVQIPRSNVGLPAFIGMNEILVRLFQSSIDYGVVLELSALVVRNFFQRYAGMFEYEIKAVCDALSQQDFTRAWDVGTSQKNQEAVAGQNGHSLEFLRYIYDDLHVASLYSDDERILMAHSLCARLLGIQSP